ncbi:MAG: hypothetical protein JO317_06530, partial [Verrucomicrobiae bacterium]|nr:hypothetical protein [Verrucomicrobiae bacterium]
MNFALPLNFRSEKANAFVFTLTTVAILSVLVGGLVQSTGTQAVRVRRSNDSAQAFLIASSAIEKIKADLVDPNNANSFASYYNSTTASLGGPQFPVRFDFFKAANLATNGLSISYDGTTFPVPNSINMGARLGDYPITARILASRGHSDNPTNLYGKGEIVLQVSARFPNNANGVTRTVTETVRYGIAPHKIFDYAYFINNFGWMWGSTITINGDVRSNRNFSFNSNPKLN